MATGLTTGGENRRDKHRCCLPSLSPFTFAGGASPPQPRQQEEQTKGPTQSINVIVRPWTIKSSLLKSRFSTTVLLLLLDMIKTPATTTFIPPEEDELAMVPFLMNELVQLLKCDGKQCLDITHAAATAEDGPGTTTL